MICLWCDPSYSNIVPLPQSPVYYANYMKPTGIWGREENFGPDVDHNFRKVHLPGAQFRYLKGLPPIHCQPLSSALKRPVQSFALTPRSLVRPKWPKEMNSQVFTSDFVSYSVKLEIKFLKWKKKICHSCSFFLT